MTLKTRVFGPDILTERVMRRFWAKVTMAPSGCLEWQAAKSPNGYGKFGIGKTTVHQAHRISYVWAAGAAIPSGLDVDHLCRNRGCVSPAHLEAVDRATNIARSTARGAPALLGECQRGHDMYAPDAWYEASTGFRGCRLCRNANANARQRTPEARAKRNERRRWLRANDPEYAERERERDRQRYAEGRR